MEESPLVPPETHAGHEASGPWGALRDRPRHRRADIGVVGGDEIEHFVAGVTCAQTLEPRQVVVRVTCLMASRSEVSSARSRAKDRIDSST